MFLSQIPFVNGTAPAVGGVLTCGLFYSPELSRGQCHFFGFFKIFKFGRDTALEWISTVVKKADFTSFFVASIPGY